MFNSVHFLLFSICMLVLSETKKWVLFPALMGIFILHAALTFSAIYILAVTRCGIYNFKRVLSNNFMAV